MNFIDTHTHLFTEQFNEDRKEVVQRAVEAGISKLLLPNIDLDSIDAVHQMVSDYPENCIPMMGLHPCSVTENWEDQLSVIKGHLFSRDYIAVGEIGMDLYWDKSTKNYQEQAFAQQIEWAKELQIPIVIHVRDAFDEAFEVVDQLNDERLTGVFHCFTGSVEQAQHIISYGGFKMGLGGVLTFKNSGLDKVIKQIDMAHFVLETDSPYLAPTPYRGKRNESSYLTYVASKLAEIKNIPIEEVAEITTKNAEELFGI
ncbi:MAG: TatD family hydrolase [Crocinitomicaceae bacterium]|nr:TatD family hydrolase [Crocinitomicaceae bacterium]